MRKIISLIGNTFLHKKLDFRVRLYNVLAMSGVPIGLAMAIGCVYTNAGIGNILVNLMIATGSFLLLLYSIKSGKYQRCYTLSIVIMFFIMWPALFFTAGGYHSGMPSFFVFAVLFTVFMLDGKKMFIMTVAELLFFAGLCLIAYYKPETVNFFKSEWDVMSDIIIGFTTVSCALGITMSMHFRLYKIQQQELEAAREEALNLSKAKSNFLANMSHEIRTPINVMLGMNELVLRESDSGRVRGYSTDIHRAGATLLLLINNVLDVSKIESGKLMIENGKYDVGELIKELSMIGNEQAAQNGLSFHAEIDKTLPSILIGDPMHIKQVAVNFLSNAAKYTKQGSITLSVSHKANPSDQETLLRIAVNDTGIGIRQENLHILFEAFTRADMPSNKYIEGTGLGLAISKELAELMGGKVSVESTWGEGSTFSLEITQTVHDRTPIGSWHIQKDLTSSPVGFIAPDASVLVVDDNRENLQVIRSLLSRTLMRVDTVSSGSECLVAVGKKQYDVILMDYMMPDMNGAETFAQLEQMTDFDTPVVALTANVIAGTKEKLLAAGFIAYLSKPVMWGDLEKTLLSVLPSSLTIKRGSQASASLSEKKTDELAEMLLRHGIVLRDGLHYLGDDIKQYGKLASFFIENYPASKSDMENLTAECDFAIMRYGAHSLKSRAKALGANFLSAAAGRLEQLCTTGNSAHILTLLPVMNAEWQQVYDGLCLATEFLAPIMTGSQPANDTEADYSVLSQLLKHNRKPDAVKVLQRMISSDVHPKQKDCLEEILRLVNNFSFRDAERLLDEMRGDRHGE